MKKVLLLAAVITLALFVVGKTLGERREQRNYAIFPEMARSQAFGAQSPNPFLPGGQTSQPPVAGSIARGRLPYPFDTSAADLIRAGRELSAPWSAKRQPDLQRGNVMYQTFCQPCHGAGGLGDGPVVQRGYPPPPSLLLDKSRALPDGALFHIITRGMANMPEYASQIGRQDRWEIVAYLRTLQTEEPPPLETTADGASGGGEGQKESGP